MNLKKFPLDTQICAVVVQSKEYSKTEVIQSVYVSNLGFPEI